MPVLHRQLTLTLCCRWTEERLFNLYHRCGLWHASHAQRSSATLAVASSSCRTFWLDKPDGTRKLYAGALKAWVLYIDELRAQGRDVDYCVHPHSKVSKAHDSMSQYSQPASSVA